jgi:cytochrome c553
VVCSRSSAVARCQRKTLIPYGKAARLMVRANCVYCAFAKHQKSEYGGEMLISLKRGLVAASLALSVAVSTAAAFEGDPERGRVKADTCLGCHAIPTYTNTYPVYHVPKVGGQHEEYIIAALLAYRSGQRDHETMHGNAAGLSDQDIADIAAYFASVGE